MNRIPLPWADKCRRRISGTRRNNGVKIWAVVFWLIIWFVAAESLDNDILLASPVDVIRRLISLVVTVDFWQRALRSYSNVIAGLAFGAAAGILLGSLSARYAFFGDLVKPPVALIRTVPVASFIILALFWMGKGKLSIFISAIICLPVFFTNTLEGIASSDKQLLEMAKVFGLGGFVRIRAIYLPALLPYMRAAFATSVGLAWKSAVAAEVIAVPAGSVGEMLYYAKVWLETADLMCWTLMVVALSGTTGYLIGRLLERWAKVYE